jgi:hypothetical protein
MPLLAFLKSEADVVHKMPAAQLLGVCGDGRLRDGSECSLELREYLRSVDSSRLNELVDQCLVGFDQSGSVLQDLVNEIGRRLEFSVENGRYQGKRGEIGFDGLWRLPDGFGIVVEVKTTDVYSINLDIIATYRERLIEAGEVSRRSSILVIVGRQDTGSLEAQIRGSRHAWDVRMVSVDAMVKLLKVKEQGEDATAEKIAEILIPFEYTKIDRIIDIVFAAARDVQDSLVELDPGTDKPASTAYTYNFTPTEIVEAEKLRLIREFSHRTGLSLVKKTRSQFWSADDTRSARFVCTISKTYPDGGYWYAYHPNWDLFLSEGNPRVLALGMIGQDIGVFIPRDWLVQQLDKLGMTGTSESGYWHIIVRPIEGELHLITRSGFSPIALNDFVVRLGQS